MRALAVSLLLLSSACASPGANDAATAAPIADAEQHEIALAHVGSGMRLWSLCPGCSGETDAPLLRPLRDQRRNGNALWALSDEYIYVFEATCEAIVIPKGFVTDLASVPPLGRIRHNPAN